MVLPENDIAARNKDELSVTNSRMLDQMISDYEIKHRLRHTAERNNHRDKTGACLYEVYNTICKYGLNLLTNYTICKCFIIYSSCVESF